MNISAINNIYSNKSINKVTQKITNPIPFKGNLTQDVVEFSSKGHMPKALQTQMQIDTDRLLSLKAQSKILGEELKNLEAEMTVLEGRYRTKLAVDSYVRFVSTYEAQEAYCEHKRILADKQGRKNDIDTEIKSLQKTQARWEVCKQKFIENDKFAQLYQPNLSFSKKEMLSYSLPNITSASSLEEYADITPKVVASWISSGVLDVRKFADDDRLKLVDLDIEKNQNLIKEIRERMQYAIPAKQIYENSGFSEEEFNSALKNGGFKVLGYPLGVAPTGMDSALIDMVNPTTQKTIQEQKKITPFPSKKFFRREGTKHLLVPASYLEKLGYGKVRDLRNLVKQGLINGEINIIDTPDGKKVSTRVDIGEDSISELKLQNLRNQNRRVEEYQHLAHRLELPARTLLEAMKNGEIDIIPEFILPSDKHQVYIDKARSKNHSYLEKVTIEAAFKQSVRKQNSSMLTSNSLDNKLKTLRMQLIWTMCPTVRKQGNELVQQDKELVKIFTKTGKEEPLNGSEKVKLDQFHNDLWTEKADKEFSNAQLYADKIIHDYEAGGIEAIDNPALAKVIEHYYS